MTTPSTPSVDVHGPVFISYRQSDGTEIANDMARVLRASGVPVWRDKNDLPPGDTTERLRQALAAGVSGAVLIVTKEIANSAVVRDVELPRILELHRSSDFALQIVNDVLDSEGIPDYDAPDILLSREAGELGRIDQQASSTEGLFAVGLALAELRVARRRGSSSAAAPMAISVQTRNVGRASDISGATLDLRFEGGADRLPTRIALGDLQKTAAFLPTLITVSGAGMVDIEGGAHLSVAFAIGAALPRTRVPALRVRPDAQADWWGPVSSSEAISSSPRIDVQKKEGRDGDGGQIAVYVDLIENPDSDMAFEDLWAATEAQFASRLVIKRPRTWLSSKEGSALAGAVMSELRKEWGRRGNGIVHLFLRVPFPMAVLLGHLSNTLECLVYEWDGSGYTATVLVTSGAGAGAVKEVRLRD